MALSEKDLSEKQGRPPDRTGEDVEFLDYILVLFRYRWLIFWMVGLCTAGIVIYASVQEPEFQAVATIYTQQQDRLSSVLSGEVTRRNVVRKLYQYERDDETHVVDLTEILGAGSEQRAVQTLRGMVRFLPSPDQQYVTSIVVMSPSPRLSAIVANEYVLQLLRNEYDDLKQRRRRLHASTPKDLVSIREIDRLMNTFETLEMKMDQVGVGVFQGFQIGSIEVDSLAVPPEVPVERYGMSLMVAASMLVGLCISIFLVSSIEFVSHKRGRLASLTNESRKDVEQVSSTLKK